MGNPDGKTLWKHEYECQYGIDYASGPRVTPTVDGERVYGLGAEGHLVCLDVKEGSVIWSRDFEKEFDAPTATWGHASHPLVDGDRLFCVVGGKGAIAVAFDKPTGKEVWRALIAKEPGYCPGCRILRRTSAAGRTTPRSTVPPGGIRTATACLTHGRCRTASSPVTKPPAS